ncbi:MAG: YihA family ribosome biogenesis GTP-binding protein [Methylococcales bacterium]|jgi:GTP-binding protein|nr:YihA family ribosome biogenesis GTP-binding protein [Methylococcales bacterium]MBT7409389.1 YihA family ribosome biogenesis GTP-binding protein [Methylococcales bacterium]
MTDINSQQINSFFQQANFIKSVPDLELSPEDRGVEIAFAGRSNAGKSSAINRIAQKKALARTSKTPGRTQHIVFFSMDEERRMVDLPGYGFAKVPQQMKIKWQQAINNYLANRQSLQGLVLMMDVRHPLRDYDMMLLDWCQQNELAIHVLLTKADKLKKGPAQSTLLQVRQEFSKNKFNATVQLFSSTKSTGVDEARRLIWNWLNPE